MTMTATGHAHWSGGIKDGKGTVATESGALDHAPYGFNTRFEDAPGTNPEELIGAAHAGCFTMALSKVLGEHDVSDIKSLMTKAKVTLEKKDDGFAITKIHLTLEADLPGTDQDTFEKAANIAKDNCPVSKLLNAEITLDATLV